MTVDIQQMKRICSSAQSREHLAQVFRIPAGFVSADAALRDSDGLALATDGHMMLVVRASELGIVEMADAQHDSVSRWTVKLVEEVPPPDTLLTTAEKILAWTGPAAWGFSCVPCKGSGKVQGKQSCSRCKGDGYVKCYCINCDNEHEKECGECRGEGTVELSDPDAMVSCDDCDGTGVTSEWTSEYQVGSIVGVVVDQRRLARLMSVVNGDCRVWRSAIHTDALMVRGAHWQAVLMALREEPKTTFEASGV